MFKLYLISHKAQLGQICSLVPYSIKVIIKNKKPRKGFETRNLELTPRHLLPLKVALKRASENKGFPAVRVGKMMNTENMAEFRK